MFSSADIFVDIKARLSTNSPLLEAILTQRAAKIAVLDGSPYPEFRLTILFGNYSRGAGSGQ